MRWLLWKDWRGNRVPMVGAAVMVVAPYLLMWVIWLTNRRSEEPGIFLALPAAALGLGLAALMAAVFGGVAFAVERRERSADFLAMLPPPRWKVVSSKLLVAVGGTVGMMAAHLLVVLVVVSTQNSWRNEQWDVALGDAARSFAELVAASTALFGLAWLFSTFLSSPSVSALVSIGVTLAIMMVIGMCIPKPSVELTMGLSTALLGVSSFVAGTAYYLRRVAP